ncbi:MAG TPA: ECF transporter S component [Clostridia bacterium]|nr:ECF transporter S component [Clostridia bacterium]
MNKNILWITRTAAFVALLIALQFATSFLNNTIITGSIVNLILVISVMMGGVLCGVTVAALSPIFAKFLGIGPLWAIVPFIALGNITLVLFWNFIGKRETGKARANHVIALIVAAVAKFLVLYISIVKVAIPFLLDLPEKQAGVISGMFSIPQLITALIGGVLAAIMLPILQRAVQSDLH